MSLKLHAFPLSPRGFKVLAAANHLGLDYEFIMVNLGSGEQKRPEFLALNPNARMPYWRTTASCCGNPIPSCNISPPRNPTLDCCRWTNAAAPM